MALDVVELLRCGRWGALATVDGGRPHASMVAYAASQDLSHLVLHVSRLAAHSRHLLVDPRVSLVVSESDSGDGDPQTLARVTMDGHAQIISRGSADYPAARDLYISRLPRSRRLFGFEDFMLVRLVPGRVRYVGGFGAAKTYTPDELKAEAGTT